MSTFQELTERLSKLKFRKEVLQTLINYVDTEFRTSASGGPKRVILTEEKVKVPETAIETVTSSLAAEIKTIEAEVQAILTSSMLAPPSEGLN